MGNFEIEHGLLARFDAVEKVAHVSGARVAAAGLALGVQIGRLALGAYFPAFIIEDNGAFSAVPLDAPGTIIQAIVQPSLVFPNEHETAEFINGDLGIGRFRLVIKDEFAAAGAGAFGSF